MSAHGTAPGDPHRPTGGSVAPAERAAELAAALGRARERLADACVAAGRARDDVDLVVVTKFFPASDVRVLAGLGVTDVGENRHQEAEAKAAELADLDLSWHFIGGLQSNKASAVAAYSAVVESVDRPKLVGPLDRGAERRGRPLDVLVQVSLDPPGAEGRAGVGPEALLALADRVAQAEHLRLRGLMAVAPPAEDPAVAFERLARLRERLLAQHPAATVLSAGMSGDLEQAVAAGATHVRLGSAVLGSRPTVQ
ncbi:YggS family pyridoxal phosphate-dependent enzyme [Nocardioides kribbensis]|uniref:YggS family pyridoxal phosphate-dependent enzyme n=2 Tax=Nocardioides kribbensis TaxID=305517 RepID=UPI0032DB6E87